MRGNADLVAYIGLALLGLVALVEWADPLPSLGAGCRVGHVLDGDTVEILCAQDRRRARLTGIDTPEFDARCPQEQRAAEAAHAALAALVAKAQRVEVILKGRDKFGRDLIGLDLDGRDAVAAMLSAGHGRRYDGGRRAGWCD